ncbi:sigma-70 family RNA polymerase sigma factor [Ornithinibacillus halophilus]|uniref:RNA polymerase sigma factor, sigma-70 family n=1 Tax=Ornithinibacillus halophilus TaxID=930117 RepID=A0A1M5I601_9BACI|nr:sigma-70 family RNA polymerase sigma factor [Ornithinibacillus halophilus]SHG23213.1 RNA polymerase sigma factor, sigma-70 family [Ornithinibacillus halophilus]
MGDVFRTPHSIKNALDYYSSFYDEPIIKTFLNDEDNYRVFMDFYTSPSEDNAKKLNDTFKRFFYKSKVFKYLTSLIYFYSIDFDKRQRKRRSRNHLILDQPIQAETERSLIDNMASYTVNYEEQIAFYHLPTLVHDKKLSKALEKLTKKQQIVLKLFIFNGLTNKEIADYFKESPQNISNIKKVLIKRLRESLQNTNCKGDFSC